MKTNKTNISITSEFAEWEPRDYLRDYYSYVEPDEKETISFLVEASKNIPQGSTILEFGSGPTLHHIFPVVPYVSEIHMADYVEKNLDELKKWVEKAPDMHSWKPFVAYTLECEGLKNPTDEQIEQREEETRRKITKFMQADAGKTDPLGADTRGKYDVVYSCYCADSATGDKKTWDLYMKNIISLVSPGGFFVTTALRKATYYKVGERYFPSANVDEHDFERALRLDFSKGNTTIEIRELPEHEYLGYTSILLAHAVKNK